MAFKGRELALLKFRAAKNREYDLTTGMKFPLDEWVTNTTTEERTEIANEFYSRYYSGVKRRQKKRRKTGGRKRSL